jgi:hypothetical protein
MIQKIVCASKLLPRLGLKQAVSVVVRNNIPCSMNTENHLKYYGTNMNWNDPLEVLALPIAQDWSRPFYFRVAAAGSKGIKTEALRATIEALTRKLRGRKWQRTHTSTSRVDGRSDSRYYRSPRNAHYIIRISNHSYPGGPYPGAADYIIDAITMTEYNILGLVMLIERDERKKSRGFHRHQG